MMFQERGKEHVNQTENRDIRKARNRENRRNGSSLCFHKDKERSSRTFGREEDPLFSSSQRISCSKKPE
jgi:hypothetical protein